MSEFPRLSQAPTEPDACLRVPYPGTVMYPRLIAASFMCGMLLSRWYDAPSALCFVVFKLRLYTEEGVPVGRLFAGCDGSSFLLLVLDFSYRSCTARSRRDISVQISRALAAGSSSMYSPSRK